MSADAYPEVLRLDLTHRWVLLADDQILPITDMYDADGEDTEEHDEVHAVIAGSDATGWYTIEVQELERQGFLDA